MRNKNLAKRLVLATSTLVLAIALNQPMMGAQANDGEGPARRPSPAKQAGLSVGEAGAETGKAFGKAGRETGVGFGQAGNATGQGWSEAARDLKANPDVVEAGKFVGRGGAETGKALGRAGAATGRAFADAFRF